MMNHLSTEMRGDTSEEECNNNPLSGPHYDEMDD